MIDATGDFISRSRTRIDANEMPQPLLASIRLQPIVLLVQPVRVRRGRGFLQIVSEFFRQ
jgi:hypothetical protein